MKKYGDITVGRKTEMRKLSKKYLKKFFLEDGLKDTYLEDYQNQRSIGWFFHFYTNFFNSYYIKVKLAYAKKIFHDDPTNLKKLVEIKKKLDKRKLDRSLEIRREAKEYIKKYTQEKEDMDYVIAELRKELKELKLIIK